MPYLAKIAVNGIEFTLLENRQHWVATIDEDLTLTDLGLKPFVFESKDEAYDAAYNGLDAYAGSGRTVSSFSEEVERLWAAFIDFGTHIEYEYRTGWFELRKLDPGAMLTYESGTEALEAAGAVLSAMRADNPDIKGTAGAHAFLL
jgi:hypothetical protein